jgi:hypothetical protein
MAWVTPPTFTAGQTAGVSTALNQVCFDLAIIGGAWASFTPAWTASGTNPVLNNGTLVGRYKQVDKTIDFTIDLTIGSTTTLGSGTYLFDLPVASVRGVEMAINSTLSMVHGVTRNSGGALLVTSTVARLMQDTGPVTNASPFAWATGDVISLAGSYEAA